MEGVVAPVERDDAHGEVERREGAGDDQQLARTIGRTSCRGAAAPRPASQFDGGARVPVGRAADGSTSARAPRAQSLSPRAAPRAG